MADQIQIRRDSSFNWTNADPTLVQGEMGFETDTNKLKVGNGTDSWNALDYLTSESSGSAVHVGPTPPLDPEEGDEWFNSTIDESGMYIYDGQYWFNSGSCGSGDSFPEAPEDGNQYARQDAGWTKITDHAAHIDANTAEIVDNTTKIAQNMGSIQQNTADIAVNTADIAALVPYDDTQVKSDIAAKLDADKIWTGTEAQYNAIGSPDADTLYFVTA